MRTIIEPAKEINIIEEVDICILGGSCTGVFAAIRAARLGAKVAVIEKQNSFGGVATSGLVGVWHSLLDTEYRKQVIAGLTLETIERLKKRNAIIKLDNSPDIGFTFNTEELKIELDELVKENDIHPYLHTLYCGPWIDNGELKGIFIENKSGRSVISASVFIDATGDGDLCNHLGFSTYRRNMQPPTMGARFYGISHCKGFNIQETIMRNREEFGLKEDWGWSTYVPGMPEITFHAETHVFDVDCSNSADLTFAEIEGRRQVRAIMDIVRKYGPENQRIGLVALPSYIGIRETRHIKCHHQLTKDDLLFGRSFDDTIANGTYRVDVHQSDKPGIIFRYLDGTELYCRTGYPAEVGRWRNDGGPYPTFYQIPFRSILPQDDKYGNVIIAGRMLDADEAAFGAVRVMVTTNQMGEAAGTAAYLALSTGKKVNKIDIKSLRKTLKDGGSIIF